MIKMSFSYEVFVKIAPTRKLIKPVFFNTAMEK